MRSFCSGRRFTCLEVLLALLLSAPISLPAQSASSPQSGPQSQAAQPATSAPSSSQSQDTAPCSSGRPILKRGTQPALPPCPDPPPDSPPAAGSGRARAFAESLPKLDRKGQRGGSFEFSQKLPNFICQEVMSRFTQRGREPEMSLDMVSADVIYDDGHETYRNVKINDRSTDRGMQELGGAWSTGEFASTLLEIFQPRYAGPVPRRRCVLQFPVSAPRFTTLKCVVKIRTGSCSPARRP